jgi:hypothetical protein
MTPMLGSAQARFSAMRLEQFLPGAFIRQTESQALRLPIEAPHQPLFLVLEEPKLSSTPPVLSLSSIGERFLAKQTARVRVLPVRSEAHARSVLSAQPSSQGYWMPIELANRVSRAFELVKQLDSPVSPVQELETFGHGDVS